MPSPRFLFLRRPRAEDALALVITGLEVLKDSSDTISVVPFLGAMISAGLGLANTVQKMCGDRERYVQLSERAAALLKHVEKSLKPIPSPIDNELKTNLEELRSLLVDIHHEAQRELRRGLLSRFLRQSSIATALDKRIRELDDAWHRFDTTCLIALRRGAEDQMAGIAALHRKADMQALYDDRLQVRFLRWSDLRIVNKRGRYRVQGTIEGDEFEGRLDGRSVIVRRINATSSFDYGSLMVYNPNVHEAHPRLAQVVGRSHPSIEKQFYVLESGIIPIIEGFRNDDVNRHMILWLTHFFDYLSAYKYAKTIDVPVRDPQKAQWHDHDKCLPSALLNEEGHLIFDASDLRHSHEGCFRQCINRLYYEDKRALPFGLEVAVWDTSDSMDIANDLLTTLLGRTAHAANTLSATAQRFIDSDLGKLWTMTRFAPTADAQLGEYGYLVREDGVEKFVCLGHMDPLLRHVRGVGTWCSRKSVRGAQSPWQYAPWTTDRVVSHAFSIASNGQPADDPEVEVVLSHRLNREDAREFFWDCAEDIVHQHGIALDELVLTTRKFFSAKMSLNIPEGQKSHVPSTFYFHQLPVQESGRPCNPWGYWSTNSTSLPLSQPSPSLPGVDFSIKADSDYTRIAAFDAEILVCVNRLRNGMRVDQNKCRFDEITLVHS